MNQPNPTLSLGSTVVAAQDQICSDLAGREVILNLKSGVYYGLDNVGTCIWSFLQQPHHVFEIRDMLLERYDVSPDRAETDLLTLLDKLVLAGLVEVRNEPPS